MLGAIADDFTGATDLAGNLSSRGYRTIVLTSPDVIEPPLSVRDIDAVVIALKTRTALVSVAVEQSGHALDLLLGLGAEQIYFKYCSTFDSTETGNIGPVLDMLVDRLGVSVTVVVPSFPANGRTVYNGCLFVGTDLLEHSSMKDHPLTPMRESDVGVLLARQSRHCVKKITLPTVRAGGDALREKLTGSPTDRPSIFVVDAIVDDDLVTIADSTGGFGLVSGGSGLALGMTGPHAGGNHARLIDPADGYRLILSGSASRSTVEQLQHGISLFPSFRLSLLRILDDDTAALHEVVSWATAEWATAPHRPVLIHTPPDEDDQSAGSRRQTAMALERFLAAATVMLVQAGARHLIVAGGETSGAASVALGLSTFRIGPPIAPGVTWVVGEQRDTGLLLNLALKSGNFGSVTIFADAWESLDG